jgi:hypothetical protein
MNQNNLGDIWIKGNCLNHTILSKTIYRINPLKKLCVEQYSQGNYNFPLEYCYFDTLHECYMHLEGFTLAT